VGDVVLAWQEHTPPHALPRFIHGQCQDMRCMSVLYKSRVRAGHPGR